MFISDLSIKRPVFATMVNLVLIVFGLFSLPRLAVDLYPAVDFPVVTVSVIYPGADPTSIEQRVLDPLESAVNGLPGLKAMNSNAYPNLAQIILQFDLDKDGSVAAQETRDRVFAILGNLPAEIDTPVVQKFDIGGAPILNIAVEGTGLSAGELSRLVADNIEPALERIDGVAAVNAAGVREPEIHVLLDLQKLSAYGISPQDVSNSIAGQNLALPGGRLQTQDQIQSLRVIGRPQSGVELANLPIVTRPDLNLRVSDVAEVRETIADEASAAFIGDRPTILLAIQKQSGANTTSVADGVRSFVQRMNADANGPKLTIVTDNSKYIEGSISAVKLDLVLGAILATIIVWFFLRDFRITLISAAALPTAVISTFALMDYLGFTLNMMSTLALSLSIGILIDDAIVVVENIHRHLSMGKTGAKAAADATGEIGLAVFATTLTLCAVFVPVAFMEGIIGRFFYQFGLTVAFAVLISMFVAFTLTPMLSSKFLVEGDHEPRTPFMRKLFHWIGDVLDKTEAAYRKTLDWCLSHRWTTVGMGVLSLVVSFVMLAFVPVSFFPKEDRSEFGIEYKMPDGTSLDLMKRKALELGAVIRAYPGVTEVVSAVGASGDRKPNKARLDVKLVPVPERTFSQDEFMDRMRRDLVPAYAVNGAEVIVGASDGGGGGGSSPIQFVFKSKDWQRLQQYAATIETHVKGIKDVVDVVNSQPKDQIETVIKVDPSRAADLGLTSAGIATSVRALFEGEKVGELDRNGETTDIRVRINDTDRANARSVGALLLRTPRGQSVPLSSIAEISAANAPATIARRDGMRQITVSANFKGKDLRTVVADIQKHVKDTIPEGIEVALSGQAEMMQESIGAMLKALGLAVVLVLMVLCAQYDRYLAPLVIMAALPLSLTGAFGALLITQQVMSVYTMIGVILLMGLVAKNGILLVDFTLQKMQEGHTVAAALMEAGVARLRPILMTTFAAGGGMLPVAIGHGVGGEAKSPMGVAVIGGLIASTALTLVVVPCLFSLVEGGRMKWAAKFGKKAGTGHTGGHLDPAKNAG
jgi:HAE1 family hydrophobic/amphiphilic exporter-1